MAITPVSSVRLGQYNNSVNFGSRKKNLEPQEEGNYNQPSGKKLGKLATVPVIVMMAMAPGMMDGKTPANAIPMDSEQLTELLAANTSSVAEVAPQQSQQPVKNRAYLNSIQGSKPYIRETMEIINVSSSGSSGKRSYTLTFENLVEKSPRFDMVKLYPYDLQKDEINYYAGALIYHDLGYRGFWGLIIGRPAHDKLEEIRLPDKAGEYLYKMVNNELSRSNDTGIQVYSVAEKSLLTPEAIKEYKDSGSLELCPYL